MRTRRDKPQIQDVALSENIQTSTYLLSNCVLRAHYLHVGVGDNLLHGEPAPLAPAARSAQRVKHASAASPQQGCPLPGRNVLLPFGLVPLLKHALAVAVAKLIPVFFFVVVRSERELVGSASCTGRSARDEVSFEAARSTDRNASALHLSTEGRAEGGGGASA